MSRLVFLVLLLALTAFAVGQTPVITEILPSSGPSSGGTTVVIQGRHFITHVCLLPCPLTVSFGDVTVTAEEESNERLVVVTPAHAPGTVDVTVNSQPPVTLRNGFDFLPNAEANFEQVLFPIYLEGVVSGAFGTQWKTDLWIRNNGTSVATLAPWVCPVICPPVFPFSYSLAPGETLHNLPELSFSDPNPSMLLYISKEQATDVSLGLRVADVSRSSLNGGTELPIVRQNQFLRKNAQLFDVPMSDPKFRVLLRIYDMALQRSRFRVSLYPQTTTNPTATHSQELAVETIEEGAFRMNAAYGQLDISGLLRLEHTWPAAVRIEIEPLLPGSRYWAFASVTNNETQLVTIISPQ